MPEITLLNNEKYDVVQLLESVLASAKEGKYEAIAIAAVGDGLISSGWATSETNGWRTRLLGATSHIQFRLNLDIEKDDVIG